MPHRVTRAVACSGLALVLGIAASFAPAHAHELPQPVDLLDSALLGKPGDHTLWGVSASTADDVFAVGVGGDDYSVRARHFDGDDWSRDRPDGKAPSDFRSVTRTLPDGTAWAVGNTQDRGLVAWWNGSTWDRVAIPPPDPGHLDSLKAVDGSGPDDVWAVGITYLSYPTDAVPLMMHWNGQTWTKVDVPMPYGNDRGLLLGITVIDADDVWAVGTSSGVQSVPLLLHWDGHEWTPYLEPSLTESRVFLRAVDGTSPDDIWAVGSYHRRPALLHWDGTAWDLAPPPKRSTDWIVDSTLGVTMIGPNDVWAVGGYGNGPYTEHAQILHWNGKRWRKVKTPQPGSHENTLHAVSGSSSDNVYAVGTFSDDPTGDTKRHLILHWDGHTWTRVRPGRA